MAEHDAYRNLNKGGEKVIDTTPAEGMLKGIGFHPTVVRRDSDGQLRSVLG